MYEGPQLQLEIILGTRVHPVSLDEALSLIEWFIDEKSNVYVSLTPLHSIIDGHQQSEVREAFNHAALTAPDGMGVVWLLRKRGHKKVTRVYGPDLVIAMVERGLSKKYKHFLFGASPDVCETLGENLRMRYPGVEIVGAQSPILDELTPKAEQDMINKFNQSQADILWVALGSPKQDLWMAHNRDRLEIPVLVGVGAAFDFLAGAKPQAPFWIQRLGFEWAFRLLTEPRRLWPRYRKYPYYFLVALLQTFKNRSHHVTSRKENVQ
jgi:N-acetylglucosaminyldiphosphoundecaprenol N-acetyl-beta-D-mannosaminyltransferase